MTTSSPLWGISTLPGSGSVVALFKDVYKLLFLLFFAGHFPFFGWKSGANLQVFYDYSYPFGLVPHPYPSVLRCLAYNEFQIVLSPCTAACSPGDICVE